MCWEVELLVARGYHEVVALRRLIGASRAKWRVHEDDVEPLGTRRLIQRVAQRDVRLNLMQIEDS